MTHKQQAHAFADDILQRIERHGITRSRHWHRKQIETYLWLHAPDASDAEHEQMSDIILTRISDVYDL